MICVNISAAPTGIPEMFFFFFWKTTEGISGNRAALKLIQGEDGRAADISVADRVEKSPHSRDSALYWFSTRGVFSEPCTSI